MLGVHLWRWWNAKVCILCNAMLRAAATLEARSKQGNKEATKGKKQESSLAKN